ncbi:CBS domain-containing protein CBSX3-mitochondrial [Striga hermonthica]|uniref:CBS domain-containing protein CBSX3-mitochondrial n=1 Tax=Striga hermonthica TaxID=68872 RepID=A0A9N7RAB4_STRHE|nr:CBS domain-containing protein CBSX3-mitochondrial [Striga hermonthica]
MVPNNSPQISRTRFFAMSGWLHQPRGLGFLHAKGQPLWLVSKSTMTQHNVGALVVVKPGEEKSIAGIIIERDYLQKIIVQGRPSRSTKVGNITQEVWTHEDRGIEEVFSSDQRCEEDPPLTYQDSGAPYFLQIGESSVNNGSLHRIFSSSPRADLVDSSYTNSSFLLALEYSDLIHPTLFFSHGIGLDISESIKQV